MFFCRLLRVSISGYLDENLGSYLDELLNRDQQAGLEEPIFSCGGP